MPKLIQLSTANISNNYQLQIHPQGRFSEVSNRSTFLSDGIDFIHYNARFLDRRHNISIHIWPTYDTYPNQRQLTQYAADGKRQFLAEDWIFPLHPCYFTGVKVWCPAEAQKLVSSTYDEPSLRQLLLTCSNGHWVTVSNV
jgi:hypothetical protein